jgi:hypothetical protein
MPWAAVASPLPVVHELLHKRATSGRHRCAQEQSGREDREQRRKREPVADTRGAVDAEEVPGTKVREAIDSELHQHRQQGEREEHRRHPENDGDPTGRDAALHLPPGVGRKDDAPTGTAC